MIPLHGAANRSMTKYLIENPYLTDWNIRHQRIADWHTDKKGHVVCGCGVHQAFCWECDMDRIVKHESEQESPR